MQLIFTILRIGFGLLFIAASVDKIVHPDLFAKAIINYQILPMVLVNPVALLLPWVEFVCGAALVCNAFSRGASLVLNLLLAVFLAALWFNYSRGLSVACGCFSVSAEVTGSILESAIRDSLMMPWGLIVMFRAFMEASKERKSKALEQELKGGGKPKAASKAKPEPKVEPTPEAKSEEAAPVEDKAEEAPASSVSRPSFGKTTEKNGLDWPEGAPKPDAEPEPSK